MSFLAPKPKIPKPPNTPITANAAVDAPTLPVDTGSLITTGAQGLRRKATTQKASLIGGTA